MGTPMIRRWTVTLMFCVFAAIPVVALGAKAPWNSHHPYPRVCFSKQKWSANDHDRPCVYIQLFEDGSFNSQVEQFDGDPVPEHPDHW